MNSRSDQSSSLPSLAAALTVAGILLWAGITKAISPESVIPALSSAASVFGVRLQDEIVVASTLAAVEVAAGLFVLAFPRSRTVMAGVAVMVFAFSGVLVYFAAVPGSPSCGCLGLSFGASPRQEHVAGILRNVGMLLCLWLMWRNAGWNRGQRPPSETGSDP